MKTNSNNDLGAQATKSTTFNKHNAFGRRSFIRNLAFGGAVLLPGAMALADQRRNDQGNQDNQGNQGNQGSGLTKGDAAILRFLAAAELIETDFWQQYNEFAGIDSAYSDALEVIDDAMPFYIEQNTNDEFSHQNFLNAFLNKMHKPTANLDAFRTLSPSPVAPQQNLRLTNLMHLNVDTSWYLRYRGTGNPDFGDVFPQVVNIHDRTAIPTQDPSLYSAVQIQAIANTAAYHFAMIEQGGSSLYDNMSLRCSGTLPLRIVTSIGGTEVAHFEIWHDTVGHTVPLDTGDGLVFPDLEAGGDATDPEAVMPRPCKFISEDLPLCSIIRPTSNALAGATAAAQFFTDTGLFHGQSQAFFNFFFGLAAAADSAMRSQD